MILFSLARAGSAVQAAGQGSGACSEPAGEHGGLEDHLVGGPRGRSIPDQVDLDPSAQLVVEAVLRHAPEKRDHQRLDAPPLDLASREDVLGEEAESGRLQPPTGPSQADR